MAQRKVPESDTRPAATAAACTPSDKLYQIISTYFANVFVTSLHDMAVSQAARPDANMDIRQMYADVTQKYIHLMKLPRTEHGVSVYEGALKDMHAQYVKYCGPMSWGEYIELLQRAFLPGGASTPEVRDRSVARVIVTTIIKFRAWIITESGADLGVGAAEWKRAAAGHGEFWRDTCYAILRREIDEICAYITASRDGVPLRRGEAAGASRQVLENLQQKLRETLIEKAKLIEEMNRYAAGYKEMRKMVDRLVVEKNELQTQMGIIAVGKGAAAARGAPARPIAVTPNAVLNNYLAGGTPVYNGAAPAAQQGIPMQQGIPAQPADDEDFADVDALTEDVL